MGALLEWVCEAHLRQAASYQSRKLSNDLTEPAFLHDKCLRVCGIEIVNYKIVMLSVILVKQFA